MIYVIGTAINSNVKIGLSGNPELRLKEIQRMSPVPLVLLAQFPGDSNLEKLLHAYFADARQWGEWFEIPDAVIAVERALSDPLLRHPRTDDSVELVMTDDHPELPREYPGSPWTGKSWKRPRKLGRDASRVYRALLTDIQAGQYQDGDTLPRAGDLAVEYGVSTITAVQAVMHLDLDGIVSWSKGSGARVL